MKRYQSDQAHHLAGCGYGWEDICVRLDIRWGPDRLATRQMVLRGTWRGAREAESAS